MNASVACISCLVEKQERKLRQFQDEEKNKAFFQEFLTLLQREGLSRTAPWLQAETDKLIEKYFGMLTDYPSLKSRYNQYLLAKESLFEENIGKSEDKIAACIRYSCAGNYIDTTAVDDISDEVLEKLLHRAETETVDPDMLSRFRKDLSQAREFVFVLDNCGEIVLDKLLIRHIREEFPHLHATAVVRGGLAENDATMEDAIEVGLTAVADCVENGSSIMGTDLREISPEAAELLRKADVILAKGQANFETLHGSGLNPYFLFLCKCEFFTRKFGLPRFTSVFMREDEYNG